MLYGWFFQNHGYVSCVEWKMMVSSVLPPNRNLVVSSNQDSDGVFHQTEIWSCNLFNLYSKKKLVLISTRKILLLVFSPKNTCWWCFSSKTTFSIFKRKFGSAQIWCATWKKFIMNINNSMNTYNMNSICKRLVVYLPLAIRSSCWNRFNLWFPNSNLFF